MFFFVIGIAQDVYKRQDITLAMDCAASEFYKDGKYVLAGEGNKAFTSEEFTHFLEELTKQYPIVSIEDGLDESDWDGFAYQTKVLGDKIDVYKRQSQSSRGRKTASIKCCWTRREQVPQVLCSKL